MKPIISICLYLSFQFLYSVLGQNTEVKNCDVRHDSGPCLAFIPMYAYDNETDSCIQFTYGGCQGNGNRFSTKEECMTLCYKGNQKINANEVCALEPESGACLAYIPKYFYNTSNEMCQPFIYGGCGGNENRFDTIEECQSICDHKVKIDAAINDSEDSDEDVCNLGPEVGPCKARLSRFYYDNSTKQCTQFFYGGCYGNENNFNTTEECEKKCVSNPTYYEDSKSICELDVDSGPCEALIERYHFDKKVGKCEKFVYGGCQGNANNFETINDCEQTCANQTIRSNGMKEENAKVCEQSSDTGPCKGLFLRYFYDVKTGMCQQFIFGGCNGNSNNFQTYDICQQFCVN